MFMESNKERALSFDIRRTIILGAFIKEWSMPQYRVILNHPEKAVHVEIYYFPAAGENDVARFSTVGLSNTLRSNGQPIGTEWVMALPYDLGGESVDRIFSYVCDLIAHHIVTSRDSRIPIVMEESKLAPANWSTKAFFLDELRGESEDLEEIQIGNEVIRVVWALPITAQEATLILREGVDAFDSYMAGTEHSIIDPRRP
ncbi:suppressor of fused domain protein [Paenibacillus methanolicus]|uniref:Suppressor of fused protein SUFU n=1 Tax=Paenibacillus methanolicus TaxID=582686 RepID=A0A5S5C445_9BACL|nr:suppressor of fused domain protein [Paenibacillus methanolicus]TYP73100.1 suppressor of fused protein SUFU [Paenibacillus methanolicus]